MLSSTRARLQGADEPNATIVHVEGATAGTDPTSGHKRHQEENRHKFVRKWKATLDRDHLVPDVASRRFAADRNRRKHVLVVDHRTPMWDRDAGSLRTLRMMQSLISLGARVTLLPDNVSRCDPYTTDLERMGIEVMYEPCDVARELAETGASIDFAILSRPHPASHWLDTVREHAPRATVAYDTVDLHWLRESRRGSVAAAGAGSHGRSGVPAAAIVQKSNALRELELAMIRATDVTITTTEHERAIVEEEVPGADVLVLPTVYDVAAHVPPFEGRSGILFLGGFEHAPNVDAAKRLVSEIMPLILRELADAHLTIVGAEPPSEIRSLASSHIEVAGWVEDLDPVLARHRLMLAPLSFGAGMKGKVVQCLAAGLPVVTTGVGAEGIEGSHESILVADDDQGLAALAVKLHRDQDAWNRASQSGQLLVGETCSHRVITGRLAAFVSPVPQDRSERPAPAGAPSR